MMKQCNLYGQGSKDHDHGKINWISQNDDIGEKTIFRNQSIYDEEGVVSVLWLYY